MYHFQGLISTAGYCKFSAWKRETEIPRQAFSRLILSSLASQTPGRYIYLLVLAKNSFQIPRVWLKDQTTGRSETFGEAGRHVTNVGAGLAKLGVGAGTVVCVWASNYVEYWLVSGDIGTTLTFRGQN